VVISQGGEHRSATVRAWAAWSSCCRRP
jgi:hypothetical protein